jgi:DNA-binding transcriptional regulator YdaS (Cro superfamily)
MDVKQFIKTFSSDQKGQAQLAAFAKKAGTSVGYLRQLAGGHRKASADMAILLEEKSNGLMRREDIRPDYWPPQKERAR